MQPVCWSSYSQLYVILDGVLRLVFWSCSSAVVLVTPETIPQKNDAG